MLFQNIQFERQEPSLLPGVALNMPVSLAFMQRGRGKPVASVACRKSFIKAIQVIALLLLLTLKASAAYSQETPKEKPTPPEPIPAIKLTDKEIEKLDKALAQAASSEAKLLVVRSVDRAYWVFSTAGIAERNKNTVSLKEGAEVTVGERWGTGVPQTEIIESLVGQHEQLGRPYSGPYFMSVKPAKNPGEKETTIVAGTSGRTTKQVEVEVAEILPLPKK